ncbi:hypothetical protein LPTSP4_10200 [Leptospira ryugenii]|uniref:Uncharacterized protein n=1 Tax=Leptospira ryugenii TaxID=1917863 RepID=A0A2P2DY31_9LEPT|nr:hypothetical protein [Leptospira ryugenii]GBF49506.1 hypothetical protein LPTSP4_10200 [Leptospira ryugenii]
MQIERESILSQKEKLFLITKFTEEHPEASIQDYYKWLYFGEFGEEEFNTLLTGKKQIPELHVILSEIKQEATLDHSQARLWEPLGVAARFVKVYVSPYYLRDCPIKRLVNLIERSPAFRGSRMTFKLDWNTVKDLVSELRPDLGRRDFINFEERINFHQLPELSFTDKFVANNPLHYRIVSQKLFFDYFPEYMDNSVFHPFDHNNSLIG